MNLVLCGYQTCGKTSVGSLFATTYDYDALNRITQVTYPNTIPNLLTYDAVGNVTSVTDGNGATTNYIYDSANRTISRDYPGNNDDVFTYDAGGRILSARPFAWS